MNTVPLSSQLRNEFLGKEESHRHHIGETHYATGKHRPDHTSPRRVQRNSKNVWHQKRISQTRCLPTVTSARRASRTGASSIVDMSPSICACALLPARSQKQTNLWLEICASSQEPIPIQLIRISAPWHIVRGDPYAEPSSAIQETDRVGH